MTFNPKQLVLLAALTCMALPAAAADAKLFARFDTCTVPSYPRRAQNADEEGVSVLGFLVNGEGKVVDNKVLNTSGSRSLDHAAAVALSRCAFQRPADIDKAVNLWVKITYAWSLGNPGMLPAASTAALAANNGNVSARYHLSLILFMTAKTDADRAKALVVLRSAAELGHAHAQFDLGRRYETGEGMEANLEEALRWYRKAADQGDPLARQRLTLGVLLS